MLSVACHLRGALNVAIYAPYWIINQTGRDLMFKVIIWSCAGQQSSWVLLNLLWGIDIVIDIVVETANC